MSTACYQGLLISQSNSWSQRSSIIKAPLSGLPPSDISILQVHARLNSLQETEARGPLRHRGNRIVGRTHLGKNFIQPLERAMQMYLNPAGGASNILPVVLGAPALHEAHSNSAHFGEFVHGLKAMVHGLRQQLSKLLIVENFQAAPAGDLADSGRMEAVMVVAVPALHKDAAVAQALGIHFSSNVVQVDAFSDMSPGVFYCGVPVNVGEQPEAEAVLIVGRIGETVHQHTCGGGVERFAHAVVELIVHNRAPVFWFLIGNGLNVSAFSKP